jgi:hypothetical protein
LVRSTLAIYITLSAVVVVAIAQILFFKLVLSREDVTQVPVPEPTPTPAPEPVLVPERVLAAA